MKSALRSLKLLSDLYITYSQRYRPASLEDSAPTASSPNSLHLWNRWTMDLVFCSPESWQVVLPIDAFDKAVDVEHSLELLVIIISAAAFGNASIKKIFYSSPTSNISISMCVAVTYFPSSGHFPFTSFLM